MEEDEHINQAADVAYWQERNKNAERNAGEAFFQRDRALDVLRELVEAMPKCNAYGCERTATRYFANQFDPSVHCDEHDHPEYRDLPIAQAVRRALRLLADRR